LYHVTRVTIQHILEGKAWKELIKTTENQKTKALVHRLVVSTIFGNVESISQLLASSSTNERITEITKTVQKSSTCDSAVLTEVVNSSDAQDLKSLLVL